MSILSILSIAAESLKVQQKAIQTTGHNIANSATPGFARQRVAFSASVPSVEGEVTLGRGVRIDGIQSVVDKFLEDQLITLNGTLGFTEAEGRALAEAQGAFPVGVEGGILGALDSFFGALSDLSNNPAGQAERVNLIGKARILGVTLSQTRVALVSVQTGMDRELSRVVQQVNALLPQIAKLNAEISKREAGGNHADDFRDQRQILLQEVVRLTGATVFEGPDGQVSVLSGGVLFVSGDRAGSLDDTNLDSSGFRLIFFQSPDGLTFDATALMNKGEIGGIIKMRDTELPSMIGRLDQLAKTLVDEVNTQHALGFDLNGTAGGNFFDPIGVVAGAANNVAVTSAVISDPTLIASAQVAAGGPGDNRNMLAMINLRDTTFGALGNTTLKDYFLSLVGDIGAQTEIVDGRLGFERSLLEQTQARRDGVSGVNLGEEMTNLILFQRAFEAASLLVRTGDEMYQAVLEMIR